MRVVARFDGKALIHRLRKHFWVHFIHHAMFALLMTALTLLLDESRLLDWLDAALLRVVGTTQVAAQRTDDSLREYRPAIVDLDRDAYVTIFHETSPLERTRLGELLSRVGQSPARVVVIDIDLAPTASEWASQTPRTLDATLDSLARTKQVVLALPEPSATNANLGWIRARCAVQNIHFGTPDLPERLNAVTRVGTSATLAMVALALDHQAGARHEIADQLCHHVRDGIDSETALHRLASESEHDDNRPLLPDATSQLFLQKMTSSVELRGGRIEVVPAITAAVVFVGGSYETGDAFKAFGQNLSGLQVHAASFASLASRATNVPGVVALLIDVALGILLGYVFQFIWENFVGRDRSIDESGASWMRDFILYRARVVVAWAAPLIVLVLLAWFAQFLLVHRYWLNPAPIVVGMFIHARTARHETSQSVGENGVHGTEPVGLLATLKRKHPDTVYTQPVLALLLFATVFIRH